LFSTDRTHFILQPTNVREMVLGDGTIFVSTIEDVIRIGTGEFGIDAISRMFGE